LSSDSRTGKFKLPFYPPPLDINLTKDRISYMKPMPDTYMYVRINHPSYAEERADFNFFSDLANVAFTVPVMHDVKESDGLGKTDDVDKEAAIQKLVEDNKDLEEIIENQKVKLEEYMNTDYARYMQLFGGQNMIYNRLNQDPFANPDPVPPNLGGGRQPSEEDSRGQLHQITEPVQDDEDLVEMAREQLPTKGIKVTFIALEKIVGTKAVKIEMKIFYENQPMIDDRGEPIEFTTEDVKSKAKTEKKAEDIALQDVVKIPYNFSGLFSLLKKRRKKTANCYIKWRILRVDSQVTRKMMSWHGESFQ
jgi:hypothetical protein